MRYSMTITSYLILKVSMILNLPSRLILSAAKTKLGLKVKGN